MTQTRMLLPVERPRPKEKTENTVAQFKHINVPIYVDGSGYFNCEIDGEKYFASTLSELRQKIDAYFRAKIKLDKAAPLNLAVVCLASTGMYSENEKYSVAYGTITGIDRKQGTLIIFPGPEKNWHRDIVVVDTPENRQLLESLAEASNRKRELRHKLGLRSISDYRGSEVTGILTVSYSDYVEKLLKEYQQKASIKDEAV